jgi:hypothetical protein
MALQNKPFLRIGRSAANLPMTLPRLITNLVITIIITIVLAIMLLKGSTIYLLGFLIFLWIIFVLNWLKYKKTASVEK